MPRKEYLTLDFFPNEISSDPWILYHGTSSTYEQFIDTNGIDVNDAVITKSEIEAIVSIYDELIWAGTTGRSLLALKSYSLSANYGANKTKPVFLSESPRHSALFATKDFAGGETVRGAHASIMDLELYLESDEVKSAHHEIVRRELRDDPFSRYGRARLDGTAWLRTRVASLESIKLKCEAAIAGWTHGVIYAVRVVESDLPNISYYSPGHGARWDWTIPVSKIVGKAVVPASYEYAHGDFELIVYPAYRGALREWVDLDPNGVDFRLRSARKATLAPRD
jgi:hypothetical protein